MYFKNNGGGKLPYWSNLGKVANLGSVGTCLPGSYFSVKCHTPARFIGSSRPVYWGWQPAFRGTDPSPESLCFLEAGWWELSLGQLVPILCLAWRQKIDNGAVRFQTSVVDSFLPRWAFTSEVNPEKMLWRHIRSYFQRVCAFFFSPPFLIQPSEAWISSFLNLSLKSDLAQRAVWLQFMCQRASCLLVGMSELAPEVFLRSAHLFPFPERFPAFCFIVL